MLQDKPCRVDDAAFGCPLIEEGNSRPYINWSVVGPSVLSKIEEFFE